MLGALPTLWSQVLGGRGRKTRGGCHFRPKALGSFWFQDLGLLELLQTQMVDLTHHLHFPPRLTKSTSENHCSRHTLSHSSTPAWPVRKPRGAAFTPHARRIHHSPCRTAGPQQHRTGSSFLLALTSKDTRKKVEQGPAKSLLAPQSRHLDQGKKVFKRLPDYQETTPHWLPRHPSRGPAPC